MKHALATAARDEHGRLVLGTPSGCRHCGAVRTFIAVDGNAVVYAPPTDCCAGQIADRRARPARATPLLPPRRRDIDE